MRRTVVLLATMALTLLVASGVALAVTKIGTDGPDTLMGTKGSDVLSGKGGTDWIDGRGGNDVISGGPGNDDPLSSRAIGMLDGGPGADVISGGPGMRLFVRWFVAPRLRRGHPYGRWRQRLLGCRKPSGRARHRQLRRW